MRLNDLLEEDLRTLKETDFMGPTTRAEFNRRKNAASGPSANTRSEDQKSIERVVSDPSVLDNIRQQPTSEQLRIMRVVFGG